MNSKMNIVILLAGRGSRFKDYTDVPKPMINVQGISILKRTTDSLPFFDKWPRQQLWFAVLQEHVNKFHIDQWLRQLYGETINVVVIPQITRGNLETAYEVVKQIPSFDNLNSKLLILDGDNQYDGSGIESTFTRYNDRVSDDSAYAMVYYFEPVDTNTHWCFAMQRNNRVYDLQEKNPHAQFVGGKPMIGVFYFSKLWVFRDAAREVLEIGNTTNSEFFMSQSIRRLLDTDFTVWGHKVNSVVPLGTPADIDRIEKKSLRLCFDLDGTICETRSPNQNYSEVKPLLGAVESLNKWKSEGHTIIIYTARNMVTFNGNIGSIIAKQVPVITDWLCKHNIPYDELVVGKPHADIFICDASYHHVDWKCTNDIVERLVEQGGRFGKFN